jgi:serine/threonine-protein kinase HipA
MGQHHMDVCGEGDAVERRHLLRLASEAGLQQKPAETMIDRMLDHAASLAQRAREFPIRRATVLQMKTAVDLCRKRLAAA